MDFHILSLFPEMFQGPFNESILKRGQESNRIHIHIYNIRDYTHDKHHTVDDYSYGGGPGMVMKPEPVFEAVESVQSRIDEPDTPVILLSARGRVFNQQVARDLALWRHVILICGHYEGVDERVAQHLATDEISLGDFVLTGGEIAAMAIVDATSRLVPGVLGSPDSSAQESHASGLLEHPQYTRPPQFRGWRVPLVLLSGNHQKIDKWRRRQSIISTYRRRPELLAKAHLTEEEKRLVRDLEAGVALEKD